MSCEACKRPGVCFACAGDGKDTELPGPCFSCAGTGVCRFCAETDKRLPQPQPRGIPLKQGDA